MNEIGFVNKSGFASLNIPIKDYISLPKSKDFLPFDGWDPERNGSGLIVYEMVFDAVFAYE